jgi:hypothetical protein
MARGTHNREGREMITKFLRKIALLGGVLLVSMSIGVPSAFAWGIKITEVFVDVPDTGHITIIGKGFGSDSLKVKLGERGSLVIISATDTEIVAELPPGISAGDYLLTVSAGMFRRKHHDLTIDQGPGVLNFYFRTAISSVADGGVKNISVSCDPGDVVTGGGFDAGGSQDTVIFDSFPEDASTWNVGLLNPSGGVTAEIGFKVYAVCADIAP